MRRRGERYKPDCIVQTYASGYELVNIWGAFCYHGNLPLRRIEGTFTNEKHREICISTLWPCVKTIYGSVKNTVL